MKRMMALLFICALAGAPAFAHESVKEKLKEEAHKLKQAGHKAGEKLKEEGHKIEGKLKVAKKDFDKLFSREDGKLWYHWSKGKKVQLDRSPHARGKARGDGETCNPSSGGSSSDAHATNLPSSIAAYADYYGGKSSGKQPSQSVDHRDKQSSVDYQWSRGTCMAFATSAAIEALNGKKKVSKEYVYWLSHGKSNASECADDGTNLGDIESALASDGPPEDVYWAYMPAVNQKTHLCPVGPTIIASKATHFRPKAVVDFPTGGDGKTGAYFNNPAFLEAALDAGYDVVSSHCVAWGNPKAALGLLDYQGILDVLHDDSGKPHQGQGWHAMLIVGYERTGEASHGGGYFWVKNSWGLTAGKAGYLRLSYDYVRTYGTGGFIIDGLN